MIVLAGFLLLVSAARRAARAPASATRLFAAPRAALPDRRVDVSCAACGAGLFRYAKANGAGSRLVKLYAERITKDLTGGAADGTPSELAALAESAAPINCPRCAATFAKHATVHGRHALRVVTGKVKFK
ncbi:hypothetical protein M885DRAFT_626388 [Pelagophyceae sp. CCMP2097]|nr:hypothetical protein M885DRAFT_626388 [Pelagophyceae sp. CCMP2097]